MSSNDSVQKVWLKAAVQSSGFLIVIVILILLLVPLLLSQV